MADVLSPAELVEVRRTTRESLPSQCVIAREQPGGDDGMGGETEGSVTYGTVVCGVSPLGNPRPIYSPIGGGAEVFVTWAIRFPVGTDVLPKDVITCEGWTYQMHQIDTGRSHITEDVALCTREAS